MALEKINFKISHFEKKINELMYKIYDLTEEEIKIIKIFKLNNR